MTENEIAAVIVDVAYKIHQRLGPGPLESVYERTAAYELRKRGLLVRRQQAMPVVLRNCKDGYGVSSRLDSRRKGYC
jgi:GxxExxY protein